MIVISTDTVVVYKGTKRDCQCHICYCDTVIFFVYNTYTIFLKYINHLEKDQAVSTCPILRFYVSEILGRFSKTLDYPFFY